MGRDANVGCKIDLDNEEMIRLIQDRRQRDILQPPGKDRENVAGAEGKPPEFVDRQLQAAVKYLGDKGKDKGGKDNGVGNR